MKKTTLSNDLLGSHDRLWAIIAGRDTYTLFGFNKARGSVTLRYTPDILPGNCILIDHSGRVYFTYQLARVVKGSHDINAMTTTVDFRSD